MNIKKLLLIALLGLSTAAIRPNNDEMGYIAATGTLGGDDVQFITKQASSAKQTHPVDMFIGTVLPSAAIGWGTGKIIANMAGTFFDAVMNQKMIHALSKAYGNEAHVAIAVNLIRLSAQIGSKFYWEKPLRHKFMDWLQATMKANGIEFDAELSKTVARAFAWLGTASEVNTDHSLALQKSLLNQLNHPKILIRG